MWGVPRLATHGWVLGLALLVLALAPLAFRHPLSDVQAVSESPATSLRSSLADANAAAAPESATQERRLPPVVSYKVQPGDTVDSVAAAADISVDTLVQVNQLAAPAFLNPGEQLVVPPVDGSMLALDGSETLGVIANRFGIDTATLRAVNGLHDDARLPSHLFVPTSKKKDVAGPAEKNDAGARQQVIRFRWPTKGIITQGFSSWHPGIDIANDVGTPEVAADAGVVTWAGWGDYGIYVEIDHGNGFHTVYGHMSAVLATKGQQVSKGQLIGLMGVTGRATGSHLHFEIRYQGVPQNPMDLLS